MKKAYYHTCEPISVHLDGGILKITVAPDGNLTMTGPAEFIYEGETID